MSLKPCIITHIDTKKVVSVNEALEIIRKDPKMWEMALEGLKNPFIANVRKSFQAALDKIGLKANVEFISDKEAEKIVKSGKPIKMMTAGFQTRDGKPIGFAYDTDQVARGRFDFSKLKKIGSGSDRDVYDLGDGKVLKVAKTARGLTQNIYEGDFYLKGIIPEVFERGLNYVVAENVKAATSVASTASDFKAVKRGNSFVIVGVDNNYEYGVRHKTIESANAAIEKLGDAYAVEIENKKANKALNEMLAELSKFTQKDFDNKKSELQDVLEKYELTDIMSYDVLWGDFTAKRNWGIKDGQPIHLDGGTFGGVDMIDSYKNKTNLSDPEFRKIYEESKRLKKQFGDTDKNTMYMREPVEPSGIPLTETDLLVAAKPKDILENLNRYSLEQMVQFLKQNDPNGAYQDFLDEDEFSREEGVKAARESIERMFEDYDPIDMQQRLKWMDLTYKKKSPFAPSKFAETNTSQEGGKVVPLFMKNAKGKVLGFVQPQPDGSYKVWIDPATTNAETPIHELAGHIFMPLLKEAAPELHAKGVELIQNTPYLKAAQELGLEGDAANEEALAQAIGEKGKQLSETKRPKFMDWLNGMWQKVGEKLGITKPIKELTLGEFTDLIAGTVLEGSKLKGLKEQPKQAAPKPEKKETPTAKNYVEARDQIAEGAELTKEQVEEELPYFLSQMGFGPLNEKTKNNKAKELFEGLIGLSQEEILDTDSSIAPKIAKWVQSVQAESGIKPMSLAEKMKAWTAAQREELKGTATSGGVLYKALLDAIDLAVDAAVKAKATAKEINAAIKKAIEDFRTQYQTNQRQDAEKAIAYLQKGAPTTVKKQIEGKNEPTKRQVQKAIDKAFAVGMGYGKQAGFQKGATEGGKAGFVTGREEGRKEGFQKGATEGGRAGFVAGKEEGQKIGFVEGATAGGKAGFITGKEVGFESGQAEGIKEGKLAAAKMMKAILSGLKAELKPSQINGILDKFSKIKNFSPEAKQRFIDYANNVIDDANYVLQERAGTKVKNRITKLSNSGTITANDASLFKQFSGLSIGKMTPETLNEFIDWGNKILGKSLQKGDRDAILEWTNAEKDRQDAITAERSAKMKAGRERNLQEEFDRLESEGDLPDGVTTFEEYKEFKKPKSKAETAEQKVEKVSQALSEIDLSEIEDDDNRAIIEALKGLDLSILNAEQLEFTANALNSFIDTGRIFGLGDIVAKAEVWNKIAGLKEDGIKFRKKVDPSDASKLSLTHIFTKFLDVNANAAKIRSAFIQTWLSKSSSAFEDYVKAESALLKLAKRLDIKQENWNRIDLFGFLNEAEGNPELFDNLLEQKKSDLEMLKKSVAESKGDESMSAKGQADRLAALEKAMSLVKGATTLEQVKANLTPYEFTMYDAAREQLDKFAPKAIKNMEAYGNTEVGYIKNYWPRTAKKLGIPKQAVKGELEDFSIYGNDDKLGKNAFGRQKGRSQLLGENGYYEPIGQINLFNGLRETMMVANAAHEYHQMQAVYNNPKGFDQLVSGDGAGKLKELFVDYIADTKNHGRFALDQRGVIKKTWDGLMNSLTSALIKNPTQLFKQPTALGYVAATAPKAMVKASDIASKILIEAISKNEGPYTKAFNKFAKNSTLALRLNIPEIIELSEQYVGDQWVTTEYFKKATKAINDLAGGEAITVGDKATSIIATLSGYIQHKIDVGELKNASDFDFLKEMADKIDMDAMSAGEQMQGKTNNENSRLLFSQEQKANSAAYFLTNFTRQAVQNLYINFRKSINPTSTPTERKEALSAMGGYFIMALSFQAASAATTAIVNQIAQTMAFGGDDDEEEKLAAIKAYEEARALGRRDGRILQELMSVGVGTQNVLVQAAVNYSLAEGFMAAKKLAKEYEGELPEAVKKRLEKEYAPLYSNETVGQIGVAAEAFITPLIKTVRAEDRKKQATQEAVVLGLKIANMGSVAYGVNKYYQAETKAIRALKESGTKGEKQLEAKLNPNKDAEKAIKTRIEKAVESSDEKALKDAFSNLMKTSTKSKYETAKDNIFDKIVDDKIMPTSISESESSRWIQYIMKGQFADKTVGKGKVKLSELVPEKEREEYIKKYKKQAEEVNQKLDLMDKALPEAIKGKWKNQFFKKAAWRKFVSEKPIKKEVVVEKPVEGGFFKNAKGIIKNIFK